MKTDRIYRRLLPLALCLALALPAVAAPTAAVGDGAPHGAFPAAVPWLADTASVLIRVLAQLRPEWIGLHDAEGGGADRGDGTDGGGAGAGGDGPVVTDPGDGDGDELRLQQGGS